MRGTFMNQALVGILLIWQFSVCIGMETPDANESSEYSAAVRGYAGNPTLELWRIANVQAQEKHKMVWH